MRLFVLFLDDYHVDKSPTIMIPLQRTLRAFVEKLGPYDLVAVMDPLTPLTHVEFSRDRTRLLEIVNKFEGRRGELFPVKSAAEEAQQSQRNVWELRAGVTLDALNAIATKLGGMREGRKSVLFVSQGPPVSLRSVNWPRMEDVVQSANRGNVTIHTLDPRPLGSSEFGGNMVLRRFSDETGGRAIFNTNDHANHLDEVIEDASAYYLVGYTPTRGEVADGKFHKIDVEVKRPRVRVTARRGYWSPNAAELDAPPGRADQGRSDDRADRSRRAEERDHGRRLGGLFARHRRRHGRRRSPGNPLRGPARRAAATSRRRAAPRRRQSSTRGPAA